MGKKRAAEVAGCVVEVGQLVDAIERIERIGVLRPRKLAKNDLPSRVRLRTDGDRLLVSASHSEVEDVVVEVVVEAHPASLPEPRSVVAERLLGALRSVDRSADVSIVVEGAHLAFDVDGARFELTAIEDSKTTDDVRVAPLAVLDGRRVIAQECAVVAAVRAVGHARNRDPARPGIEGFSLSPRPDSMLADLCATDGTRLAAVGVSAFGLDVPIRLPTSFVECVEAVCDVGCTGTVSLVVGLTHGEVVGSRGSATFLLPTEEWPNWRSILPNDAALPKEFSTTASRLFDAVRAVEAWRSDLPGRIVLDEVEEAVWIESVDTLGSRARVAVDGAASVVGSTTFGVRLSLLSDLLATCRDDEAIRLRFPKSQLQGIIVEREDVDGVAIVMPMRLD